ncbi:MAG: N-acetyl-gamma-glutamyl-phosphate reductase, partial [Pseudomonadota bacterium]|nr:N-acetyl-gamma-glutamyl-phosphate reductase [Pseudomonadota bacterium]
MTHKVFIDGAAGTTGIEIADRLAGRSEFEILR